MKTIQGMVLAAVVAGTSSMASAGTTSINEAAAACEAQATAEYAVGGSPAHVRFKGVYGSGDSPKVRLQVVPAGGKSFLAICAVEGLSGEVVALAPAARSMETALAAIGTR